MKEDLCAWYQGFDYEYLFSFDELPLSQQRKKQIDTYALITVPSMQEGKSSLVRMETRGNFFNNKCNLYLADNMNQLPKLLVLSKDWGITFDSLGQVVGTCVGVTTINLGV